MVSMPDGGVVLLLAMTTVTALPLWVKLMEVTFRPTMLTVPFSEVRLSCLPDRA